LRFFKLNIVTIFLINFHLCLQAQQHVKVETFYDLKKEILKERFLVLKKNPTVLDSLYTSYFQNGNVKSTGVFKNNKANGDWKYYYENGALKMQGPFKDNEHNGYWKYYYETGLLNMEGEIYKEIKEGEWKYYFENGNIKNTGFYRKNRKTGMWKYFNEDGSIKAQAIYENDKGRYTEMYTNKVIKSEGDIVNGKSDGYWKYYYEDGKLKAEGFEKEGQKEGNWKFYHPNDSLASEGSYTKGSPNGKWKYYYENGKLSSEGEQKEGQKEGYWKLYYSNGNFKGEGNFENGNGPYKEFYESGKIKTDGYVTNDKNDGLWKFYYESGALEGTCYYNNGVGKYVGYYQDGSLKMEGMLNNGNKDGIWKLYKENGQIAGYYKTYYENDIPIMRLVDTTAVEPVKKDSLLPYTKPNIIVRKKKSRYFNEKINEFQGFIPSVGPLGLLYRSVPVNFEYYFQERQGYEANFTLYRSPMFTSEEFIPINTEYRRGVSIAARWKFYQPDRDNGMFYYAFEVRYTRMSYMNKIVDSTISLNPITLTKTENKVEGSFIVGNRLIRDSKKEGFTLDIFIGIGGGYRDIHNSWDGHDDYNSKYFKDVRNGFLGNGYVTVPFRFGVNVGYIFKNQGKK
jgi:antitoxin component YwqK of YwqJK toxin-antitoxin module